MSKSSVAILILAVLAVLLVVRFMSLDSDPPLFYVGHGQAQLTDPYHLTHFARNRILFDDWDPFDYHRWDLFRTSLVSGFSYISFSVFGVSRATANLSAVLLQAGGIFFFLLGWLQFRPRRETLLTAGILLINSTLFFYGRLPFLENGLIFLSGLTFYIFVKFHGSVWGQVLTGFLIALAGLAGKLFGFVLLGPVVFVLVYRYRRDVAKPILCTIGGLILGAGLYLVVLFQGRVGVLLSYYAEQTTGMYGFPPGLASVTGFFKMLLTYGGESGFSEYTPFLIVLTATGVLLTILSGEFRGAFRRDCIPLMFVSAWLLCGVLGLMPFQYRPLRYALFLYLPISAICARALVIAADKSSRLGLQKKWLALTMICLTLWYLFTQAWVYFSPVGRKFESGAGSLPLTFLLALAVTAAIFLIFGVKKRVSPGKVGAILMTLLCAAYVVNQGAYIYRGLSDSGAYLSRSSRELGDLLGENAVLTGPYGATLAIDNNLKNVIYMFGLANVERDLFDKYPVTHVAADHSNWKIALRDFPGLKSAVRIIQMPIRDVVFDIYRLPGAVGEPTDFERGSMFLSSGQADSAYLYFGMFNEKYPENFFGRTHLAYAAMIRGSLEEPLGIINKLLESYPRDYVLHGFCKSFYRRVYDQTKDGKYLRLSRRHELLEKQLRH